MRSDMLSLNAKSGGSLNEDGKSEEKEYAKQPEDKDIVKQR